MQTLDRYIALHVANSTLIVMTVLLFLFSFFTFGSEFDKTGRGTYDTLQAIQYTFLSMPGMLYQLFPASALIGTMLGLGTLASNSELVAMRAAGYSIKSILKSIAYFALALIVVVIMIGEYIAPAAQQYADTQRSFALSGKNTLRLGSGLWIRDGLKFVHIGAIGGGGIWKQVNIYELGPTQQVTRIIQADQATSVGDQKWILHNLHIREIGDSTIRIETKPSDTWKEFLSPDLLNVATIKPEMMSAKVAYEYVNYLEDNGVDSRKYRQAFWAKINTPFATFVMILLAVPFIFGNLRTTSAGHRILTGTLTGVGFYLFGQVFAYVGLVYELPPFIATWLPSMLFFMLAIGLFRKIR